MSYEQLLWIAIGFGIGVVLIIAIAIGKASKEGDRMIQYDE